MIECDASAYAKTVLWAAAIHASPEAFDGIAWASRQYDGAHAYVLFGTRVQKADVEPLGPSTPVDTGRGRDILDAFAQRYEIDIIP